MGAQHSVELMAEQPSSQPGTLSVVSGPLDALDPPVTKQEVFDEMLSLLKYPLDPIAEGLKKDIQVNELDANTFTVKVILDGKKLDGFGYGKGDGTDRVRYWKKVTADRSKLSMKIEDYVPDFEMGAWITEAKEEVVSTCTINLLDDPPQLEFIIDDKDGQRKAGPEVAEALYFWTDAVLQSLIGFKTAKVKVAPDAPSIKEKGLKSMVTEAMDEHVSYENFFPQLVAGTRTFISNVPGMSLEESEGSIVGTVTSGAETSKWVVKYNESIGEMVVTYSVQDKVRTELHRILHRSPLVLESWDIDGDGNRSTGVSKAKEIQKNVNIMIDKANSWFG